MEKEFLTRFSFSNNTVPSVQADVSYQLAVYKVEKQQVSNYLVILKKLRIMYHRYGVIKPLAML